MYNLNKKEISRVVGAFKLDFESHDEFCGSPRFIGRFQLPSHHPDYLRKLACYCCTNPKEALYGGGCHIKSTLPSSDCTGYGGLLPEATCRAAFRKNLINLLQEERHLGKILG